MLYLSNAPLKQTSEDCIGNTEDSDMNRGAINFIPVCENQTWLQPIQLL